MKHLHKLSCVKTKEEVLAVFIEASSSQNYKSYAIVITFSQYNLLEQRSLELKSLLDLVADFCFGFFSHLEPFSLPSIMMIGRRRERVENRKSFQLYDNSTNYLKKLNIRCWLYFISRCLRQLKKKVKCE